MSTNAGAHGIYPHAVRDSDGPYRCVWRKEQWRGDDRGIRPHSLNTSSSKDPNPHEAFYYSTSLYVDIPRGS